MKRTNLTQLTKFVATSVAIILLTACGSSSSSSDDTVEEETTITEENVFSTNNSIPVINSPKTVSVDENQNNIMTITATDADEGDILRYSIEGGVDANKIALNSSTGELIFLETPNFELKASYNFTVGASDNIDTATQDIIVNINDVFEGSAPVITTENVSVNENQKSAFTIVASDIDGDTIHYSFEGGVDDGQFDINRTTGVVTFKTAPDYETKESYLVTVGANDGHETSTKDILVSILDVVGGSKVLQTGQTVRYVQKDDGDYLAGEERSFTRHTEVVKDERTRLYWQNDNVAVSKSYTEAKNYCSTLAIGGFSNWRLPTIKQLNTIVNRGSDEDVVFDEFDRTNVVGYWSATKENSTVKHYNLYLSSGDINSRNDTNNLNVRCVRTEAIGFLLLTPIWYSRFTRAYSTISDNEKSLQWYDPAPLRRVQAKTNLVIPQLDFLTGTPVSTGTFEEAITGCENLVTNGRNDWRLANINELLTIIDYESEEEILFYDKFKLTAKGEYFSSTTYGKDVDKALTLDFETGKLTSTLKTKTRNYRCVRTMGD